MAYIFDKHVACLVHDLELSVFFRVLWLKYAALMFLVASSFIRRRLLSTFHILSLGQAFMLEFLGVCRMFCHFFDDLYFTERSVSWCC